MGGKSQRRARRAVTPMRLTDLLRLPPGPVDLSSIPTRSTPGFDGDRSACEAALASLDPEISELQEKLFAQGRSGGRRRLLLVLQGMDTSGKGGAVRHAVSLMDPQGIAHAAFTAPTAEERRHDFLWRIRRALPAPGLVGVFDRSHYEDVLVPRVKGTAPASVIGRRYATIDRFEAGLVEQGTAVVKVMLHISREEQGERLMRRLERPDKLWKYRPGDIDDRLLWDDYRRAYEVALERCNSETAPWHVVPADRKWYRNWAVATLLVEALRAMALDWPTATYDVETEKARVVASA